MGKWLQKRPEMSEKLPREAHFERVNGKSCHHRSGRHMSALDGVHSVGCSEHPLFPVGSCVEVVKPIPRLKLQGFNNLTKSLSFNIYDVCYAVNEDQRRRYIEYIDEAYNADRLTEILTEVANIIGANVLNVARTD